MKRLILNIDDNMTEEAALWYALQVAKGGKVSETSKGKQFCFHTVFGGSRHVSVTKSKTGTETFNIWKKDNTKDNHE